MANTMMPRHEVWRLRYREHRYARHLSRPELNKRIRDIFLNLLALTPEAKVGMPPLTAETAVWVEKWTHVLEEMVLRYGPYPNGFDRDILHSEPFPNFASDLARKAAARLSKLGLRRGDVFIKFGKRTYMEKLHAQGGLRIQPASYFSHTSHNGAVRDDELTLPMSVVLSRDDIVRLVVNPQDVPANAGDGRFDVEFRFPRDYWLYCLTNSVQPRLFVDFNADACVIIRDRTAFRHRLAEAAKAPTSNAPMREGDAVYLDPLLPKSADVFVPLAKPFGYSYQDEYRFAWIPPAGAPALTHLDIELGSLADIAELVIL